MHYIFTLYKKCISAQGQETARRANTMPRMHESKRLFVRDVIFKEEETGETPASPPVVSDLGSPPKIVISGRVALLHIYCHNYKATEIH